VKIAIRIEVATDYGEPETIEVLKLERTYRDLEPAKIGLSLDEVKHVLHEMQKIVAAAQAEEVCTTTLLYSLSPHARSQGSADT
jgi:hypothetical protein